MKDDSKEVKELRDKIAYLENQLRYHIRVMAVLQAVDIVTDSKLEQAREIVSGLVD